MMKRLAEQKKLMNNRSNKPLKRLRASLAAAEYKQIMDSLPGSTKRGLERGNLVIK